jgi:hypothetical protein
MTSSIAAALMRPDTAPPAMAKGPLTSKAAVSAAGAQRRNLEMLGDRNIRLRRA